MKTPLIVSCLALAVSLVGLAAALLVAPSGDVNARRADQAVATTTGADPLARVEALAEENRALRERVAMLEAAPAAAGRVPAGDFVTNSEFEAFREEVLAALDGSSRSAAHPASATDPAFKEQVASTLEEIRVQEQDAKREARLIDRVDRLDSVMPKLETRLGLTGPQATRVRTALESRYEREAELERRWRAGESGEALGEVKRTDWETFRSDLSTILNTQQLEDFGRALRESGGGK